DDGEVALEGREIALDRRLADLELLGQLFDAPRSGRLREQAQDPPLPDQLLRVGPPLRTLRLYPHHPPIVRCRSRTSQDAASKFQVVQFAPPPLRADHLAGRGGCSVAWRGESTQRGTSEEVCMV